MGEGQISLHKPNNFTNSQVDTTTRGDHVPQNSSTVTNIKDEHQKSDTKSKGSFGNAGSLLGKLFKKKDKDEDTSKKSQDGHFGVDITKLKGEARHLNLGANKNFKSKVIQERWEKQRSIWLSKSKHVVMNG